MSSFQQTVSAIAILAALVLLWFGTRLTMRPETRLKGVLMIVMAAVLVGNVAIWVV